MVTVDPEVEVVPGAASIAVMEAQIEEWETDLAGWRYPHGFLIPTEPNAEEREMTCRDLRTAIKVMRQAIDIVRVQR